MNKITQTAFIDIFHSGGTGPPYFNQPQFKKHNNIVIFGAWCINPNQ